ncbi:imidazole glycerol phosphate synthase subunit HisH [Shewanella marisflavi]|uniref:imidazole glycerol phosphate synthase subunit HisH n=1 Tax=Shewanella marisflavi TaxID=260364 RepID=UPI003AAAB867
MLVIIDYGMGNSGSILNMIRKVGGEAIITADSESIKKATGIILPGVGSFDNGMRCLKNLGILNDLEKKVFVEKVPFLGICLGMQMLMTNSEEGQLPGLGWISGKAKRFNFSEIKDYKESHRLKVPHMGWNIVSPNGNQKLFSGIVEEIRFYFVHSYAVECEDEVNVIARSNYGYDFVCAVNKNNIYGVQFHPEKSHKFGIQLIKNFLELVNAKS